MLRTKLYMPNLGPDLVLRDHLIQQLEKNSHKPLTLISAPSGYGKSVLVSQWIEECKVNAAWLSLDSEHQDFVVFLEYFVSALQTIIENDFQKAVEFIKGQQLPPAEVIYEALIDELDKLVDNFVLVLDDYQVINHTGIHEFINLFVSYPVEKMQLTIICRRDPPLEINKLRLFNRIHEIRMADLAFDLEETKSLASKMIGYELSDEELSSINKRSEGWVLGLQMIFRTNEIQKISKELQPTSHYSVSEYSDFFTDLILKPFSDDFRNLLFISSLLARFNKELIEVLIKDSNMASEISGESFIHDLVARNLFVYAIDDEKEWYRYHHYFGEMLYIQLEKRFSEVEISSFHQAISHWFEEHEYWDEAYDHALKSGNIDLAVSIFDKNRILFFNTDQLKRIDKWLAMLPEGTLEKHLSLLVSRAVLDEAIRDADAMKYHLTVAKSIADRLIDDTSENKQLLGEFHAVYCNLFFSFERKYHLAFEHSKQALTLLEDQTQYLYNYALVVHLMTLNALGKYSEAVGILGGIEASLKPEDSISRLYISIVKSYVFAFKGDLHGIKVACKRSLPIIRENKLWVLLSTISCYLVSSSYQSNELRKAIEYANGLKEHYFSGRAFWEIQTIYIKAFALQALGENEKLKETIAEIDLLTEQSELEKFRELTKAFKVDLALRRGDYREALALAKTTDFDSVYLDYSFYFQQLTYIRLLIITDHTGKSNEIEELLTKYIEIGRTGFKYNLLMQVLLLQSIYLDKKGEKESAIISLEEAIKLSEPGGFIRIFVDHGAPIKHLLESLQQKEGSHHFISQILEAFEKELPSEDTTTPVTSVNSLDNLSRREIETLQWVAQGLRNKEVADNLNVSVETIKSHVKNSLQKLNVRNRIELVQKARLLKIIDF